MKITDITKTQGAIGGGLVGVALVILIEASGGPDWWYLVGAGCLFTFALVYSLWPGEWHTGRVSYGHDPATAAEVSQMLASAHVAKRSSVHVIGGTAVQDLGFESVACVHGVTFDPAMAKGLCVADIRRRWPRHFGKCPKGCGYSGIAYASTEHYVMGDW